MKIRKKIKIKRLDLKLRMFIKRRRRKEKDLDQLLLFSIARSLNLVILGI